MRLVNTRLVNKPVADVWEVLGPGYERAGDWASSVYVSRARSGQPKVTAAPVAGRTCETSLGPFTETIEAYDPVARRIAYSATGDKMPGFVRSLVNTWELVPKGPDRTEVRMVLEADIAFPFSVLMGWMMKMQFRKVLHESLEEFAHYVETGRPHARKVKVDASKKAKAARSALHVAA
ncbi:SRPBCC family protein [Hasllibacter sp. MH4015]|uniref:SRPBCC family protein n=1 Tax=Hasllibacter sp. MH4015 TaxID=2854029 RepID=UPI001CD293B3|nr:SRPBCC family protein [Hasllibacter sp. MH4015]